MERLPSNTITEREISHFQEDGVICLRGVFSERWIDLLRRGIEYNRLHPSNMTKRRGHSPLFFHDYNNWENIPEYKEFILHSPVGEVAGRILQSSVSSSPVLIYKEKFTGLTMGGTEGCKETTL